MSNAVFPALPGIKWDVQKKPTFSTTIKRARNGRELRWSHWSTPLVYFSLSYEMLRDRVAFPELKTLGGFFMQRRGDWDSFLFQDPDDYQVGNQLIGVGNGVNTSFQLTRTFGGFTEALANIGTIAIGPSMWNPDPETLMWSVNPSDPMWSAALSYAPSTYTVSATGVVTFNVAPANGEPVLWSGTFYYRCRFDGDEHSYSKFMYRLWELKKCEFVGCLGTKI